MFKIYFEHKIINVGNHRNFNELSGDEGVYTYNRNTNLTPIVKRLISSYDTTEIFIINSDEDAFWKDIFKNFKYKEAAGGLVFNDKDEFLAIKRYGKWDLPKGGIKKAESSRNAAMREVTEETGIDELKITDILPITFHIYIQNDELFFKKTYWFKMKTSSQKTPIPQLEEDITEAKWLKKREINEITSNTWHSLFDLWKFV